MKGGVRVYVAPGKNLRGLVTFHGFDEDPVGLGKDGNPVKLGFKLLDLETLFAAESRHDAHFVTYTIQDADGVPLDRIPRLRKDSLDAIRAAGYTVTHESIFLDLDLKDLVGRSGTIDAPKLLWHELTEAEQQLVWEKVEAARQSLADAGMEWCAHYTTRGGFRFGHALALPVHAGAPYETLVGRFLDAYTAAGLPVDRACKDWTRLFRGPSVTLENGLQTWGEHWFTSEIDLNGEDEGDFLYMPTDADLVPPIVAPDVEIVRTAGTGMPDPIIAQALVEFYDENGRRHRMTETGKVAKRSLKEAAVFPWIFDKAPLAFPGKRHETLTRAVGEVVGTLHGLAGMTPEFVFGLLYEPVGRLGEDEDWTGKLWEMTTSFYDKEEQKKAQKAAMAAQAIAEAQNPQPQDTDRPSVLAGVEDAETFRHLLGRMIAQNKARPQFFATLDGKLAHVRGDRIEELRGDALSSFLALRFRFYTWKSDAKGERTESTINPPRGLAAIVQGYSDFGDHLPTVETVSAVPVLNLDTGESFAEGYDKNSRTFVIADPTLGYEPHEDARAGIEFLSHHLLHDFPLVGEADRANALAWLLTCATATSWGSNPTPFFLLDAPKVSSGKTLLASVGAVLAGVDNAVSTVSGGGDELDKIVAAVARSGRPVWILDNLKGKVESKTLAGIATAVGGTTDFRVLGQTSMATVRSNIAKAITGNNLSFDADNNRRAVRVRIDAQDPHPERRDPSKFLHPRLHEWAREHRGELIAAAHSVLRAWIRAGRPDLGAPAMGSFEAWSFTIGNALAYAGVCGLLGNRDEQAADDDTEALRAVLELLAAKFGEREFAANQVHELLRPLVDTRDAHELGEWIKGEKDNRVLLDDGLPAWFEHRGRNKRGTRWRVARV